MYGLSSRSIALGLGVVWPWLILTVPGSSNAQTAGAPSLPSIDPRQPATLSAAAPPAAPVGNLASRVQELEAIIRGQAQREAQLAERLRRLEGQYSSPNASGGGQPFSAILGGADDPPQVIGGGAAPRGPFSRPPRGGPGMPAGAPGPVLGEVGPISPEAEAAFARGTQVIGGEAAPRGPFARPPSGRFAMPAVPKDLKADTIFGPGFQIQSRDGEFQWQFHDLSQVEGRFLQQGGQEPVTSTFLINRQWFMFAGRLTKPYEYFVSWAQGLDTITPLDVWLNVNYDQRLQFKMGRMFTPFAYEWFNVPTNALIVPERSLWYNNFGPGRDTGLMAWGNLSENRIGYAVGIFNGFRNGIIDTNDFKNVVGTINIRPFSTWDDSWLQNLNIGGGVDAGKVDNPTAPQVFRTSVAFSGNFDVGPEFFAFNNNVREFGYEAFWNLYLAYYYRGLTLNAEWDSGFEDYGIATSRAVATTTGQTHTTPATKVRVPNQGWYVTAGYFLTGETVSSRGVLKPIRDFDLRKGKFGLGAWELASRYSFMSMGNQVFTGGLADPNIWTNNLYSVDLGVNWYWTQYIKISLFWEHAVFGNPVTNGPNMFQKTSDEAILRAQIYF